MTEAEDKTNKYMGDADRVIQFVSNPRHDDERFSNKWLRSRVPTKEDGFTSEYFVVPDLRGRLSYTMRMAGGCGLSANQIGNAVRAFIMETPKRMIYVQDPQIIEVSATEDTFAEGCLSVGDGKLPSKGPTPRPDIIVVEYFNGTERIREGLMGIEARIFQHEYDHLNGFLFTDHDIIGPNLRRQMLLHQGCFEPSRIDWEPSEAGKKSMNSVEIPPDAESKYQGEYCDLASYYFFKTGGDFRQRLVTLIDTNLFDTIEAW